MFPTLSFAENWLSRKWKLQLNGRSSDDGKDTFLWYIIAKVLKVDKAKMGCVMSN